MLIEVEAIDGAVFVIEMNHVESIQRGLNMNCIFNMISGKQIVTKAPFNGITQKINEGKE